MMLLLHTHHQEEPPPMKTIAEILGGAQILFPFSFNIQHSFEEYLTDEHRSFLTMLRVIEHAQPCINAFRARTGRRPHKNEPIMRAFYARSHFRIATIVDLRNRLLTDPNLRMICGFGVVPSTATFSRRFAAFAKQTPLTQTLDTLVTTYHEGHIVGHINRDSTGIKAREKPVKVERKPPVPTPPPRKRGRPRKGESRPAKEPTRMEQQLGEDLATSVAQLSRACAWGCKKNSQGNVETWKGYKLHLDVSDTGFPISALVTGANVHDSQVAIPLEKMTELKVQHLYSVMDAAYDSDLIAAYIRGRGRVSLIDQNTRRGTAREPFTPAQKNRYKVRTTVERANSHLKDWLLPHQIFVRGHAKVTFLLMCGVVMLAAVKALQYFILPSLLKG
jgi:hypothetical protein